MIKKTKFVLSFGTIASLAAPLGAVVSCGGSGDEGIKYVSYSGADSIKGTESYFVTDGGNINDKSFNQSGYEGWSLATSLSDGPHVKKPASPAKIAEAYDNIAADNGKLILAMGYNHASALGQFSAEHPDMAFVFIDEQLKAKKDDGTEVQQGNVTSIIYKTEQAAFLEGIIASKRALELDPAEPKIGYWGGMDIPSVTSFTIGMKKGIEFYNAHNPKAEKDVEIVDGGFVGNFDGGKGGPTATKLLSQGADILMAVAGPQTLDAMAAIKAKYQSGNTNGERAQFIGVDTNFADQVDAADKPLVFDSIQKNLKKSAKDSIEALMTNVHDSKYGLGKVVEETLDGNGVKVTDEQKVVDAAAHLIKSGTTPFTKDELITEAKNVTL